MFNTIQLKKFTNIYGVCASIVGFHRGYSNHYSDGVLQHKIEFTPIFNKKLYKLSNYEMEKDYNADINESNTITDKIIYGIFSSLYYINPSFHIFILYTTIKRMEKRLRNIPMNKYDWYW